MPRENEEKELKTIEDDVQVLKKDLDTRVSELREQIKDLQKKAEKTVAERPLMALGVAFVVGMAFGIALSRSAD